MKFSHLRLNFHGRRLYLVTVPNMVTYSFQVRVDNGTPTGGALLLDIFTGVRPWLVEVDRENLFDALIASGAESVTMGTIPELLNLEAWIVRHGRQGVAQ